MKTIKSKIPRFQDLPSILDDIFKTKKSPMIAISLFLCFLFYFCIFILYDFILYFIYFSEFSSNIFILRKSWCSPNKISNKTKLQPPISPAESMSGRPVFEMKIRVGWSLATYTVIFLPSSPNFLKYTSKGLFDILFLQNCMLLHGLL